MKRHGFDYETETGNIVTVHTAFNREQAREGARRASMKHGMAAHLFFRGNEAEPCGAITYVDGRVSSKDGDTSAT